MRSPAVYRAKADEWRHWLAENLDAKPGHRRSAEHLLTAYESVIGEAEAAFGRLHEVAPRGETACAAPGCTRTFPARPNRRTCSAACRQALRRHEKAAQPAHSRPRRRRNARKVLSSGTRQSVTSRPSAAA